MSCPASDPRPSRRGRSRHRWSCRTSPFPRRECAGRNAPPVCTSSCRDSPEKYDPRNAPKSLLARRRYFRQKRHGYRRRSRRRAIAFLMLAPCSASCRVAGGSCPPPALTEPDLWASHPALRGVGVGGTQSTSADVSIAARSYSSGKSICAGAMTSCRTRYSRSRERSPRFVKYALLRVVSTGPQ